MGTDKRARQKAGRQQRREEQQKLEDTKERTIKLLQTATAELSIEGLKRRRDELQVAVKVRSKVGHKFPTGIPTRRTWLHLTAADAGGRVIFESGRPLMDGRIDGNNGDMDSMSYEPHYEVISKPDQVQIYEGVMLNSDNQVTYTLLRAANPRAKAMIIAIESMEFLPRG